MKYYIDIFRELFIKRGGLIDHEGSRDIPLGIPKNETLVQYKTKLDLLNTFPQNQRRVGACTAFGVQSALQIREIREFVDGKIWFDGFEQWKNQKEYPGKATDDGGDWIANALKSLKKFGLTHKIGGAEKQYGIGKYAFFSPTVYNLKSNLCNGYVIITGAYTKFPIIDKNYVFRKNERRSGGHCFNIVGYDDELVIKGKKGFFTCFHNWGRWGAERAGIFYLHYDDVGVLFRSWIIE